MACLMLCVLSLPGAHAAGYKQLTQAQLNETADLTLDYHLTNGTEVQALPETTFRLFKVADVDKNIRFTPTDAFKGYPVFTPTADGAVKINELDADGWTSLANTLAGYVARDTAGETPVLTADATLKTGVAGAETTATAAGLPVGLYLVIGTPSSSGATTYTPAPFLAALPAWTGTDWNFAATATVKFTTYTAGGPGPGPAPATLQRQVLKVWEDDGNEDARPASITVDLLRDGAVYDTVTLSAANNWRTTWRDLSADSQWQLVEREGGGNYQVSVSLEGVTFVVTNTYLEEIENPDTPLVDLPDGPETPGDSGPGGPEDPSDVVDIEDPDVPLASLPQTGQLWWPVPLLAAAGVVLFCIGLKRHQEA